MKNNLFATFSVILLFCSEIILSYPWKASELIPQELCEDTSPLNYKQLLYFPHQVCVCDLVFKGTVLSTNDGYSADFAVDEFIWGSLPSTSTVIRCVDTLKPTGLSLDNRYVILAFTNDWWHGESELSYTSFLNIYNYPSVTGKPSDNEVFNDCRIMDHRGSAINFNEICSNGSESWIDTKSFITNLIEIAKIQNDELKALETISMVITNKNAYPGLPKSLRKQLLAYKFIRFDSKRPYNPQLNRTN